MRSERNTLLLALLIIISIPTAIWLANSGITGNIVMQKAVYHTINLTSTETNIDLTNYSIQNATYLAITGSGAGPFKIYALTREGGKILVYENNQATPAITGMIILDQQGHAANNTTNVIRNTTQNNASAGNTPIDDTTQNTTQNTIVGIDRNNTTNTSTPTINETNSTTTNVASNYTATTIENVTYNSTAENTSSTEWNANNTNITINNTSSEIDNNTINNTINIIENISTIITHITNTTNSTIITENFTNNQTITSNSTNITSNTTFKDATNITQQSLATIQFTLACTDTCNLNSENITGILVENGTANISQIIYTQTELVNESWFFQTQNFSNINMNINESIILNLSEYFNGTTILYDTGIANGFSESIREDILNITALQTGTWHVTIYATTTNSLLTSNFTITVIEGKRILRMVTRKELPSEKSSLQARLFPNQGKKLGIGITSENKKSLSVANVTRNIYEDQYNNTINGSIDIDLSDGTNSIRFRGINDTSDLYSASVMPTTLGTAAFYANVSNITNATITLAKTGIVTRILTCSEVNYNDTTGSCSDWTDAGIPFSDNKTTITFTVTHFSAYVGGGGNQSQLQIWDDTDNTIKYSGNTIGLYANYTNTTTGLSINGTGIGCNISLNTTGTYTPYYAMNFNSTSNIYYYNYQINSTGINYFNVICTGTAQGYEILNATDNINTSSISCGQINNSEYYLLSNNLSINGATCITINVPNVIVDCAGYTITGNNALNAYAIYSNYANTTIRNCIIKSYPMSIYLNSSATSSNIYNNTIRDTVAPGCTGDGCNTAPIYIISIFANNTNITSNNIINITGGNGPAATDNTNGGLGGNGGVVYGIYLSSISNILLNKNNIINCTSGNGGTGGASTISGPGGNGGNSGSVNGITIYATNNVNMSLNNIINLKTGTSGNGGSSASTTQGGNAGNTGTVYGVYSSYSNNNTYSNNTINTLTSGNGGTGGTTLYNGPGGTGGNSGNVNGITIYATNNSNISLNNIINLTAGTSGNGGSSPATQGGNAGNAGTVYGVYSSYSNNNTYSNNTINTLTSGNGGTGGTTLYIGPGGTGGNSGNTIGILISNSDNNYLYINSLYNYNLGNAGVGGVGASYNGLNGYNGKITGLIIDPLSEYNTFFWNNFSLKTGMYVNDTNGSNYYNTTIGNHSEGNIWANVMNGSVHVEGFTLATYNGGLYDGITGSGYPYNATTSNNKVSPGVFDYAPLTLQTTPLNFSSCKNIIIPGQYTLTQNLLITGSTCITINVSNVIIDCAGYTITGNNALNAYAIYSNYANTTIRNCIIKSYPMSIYLNSSATSSNIYNNTIRDTVAPGCTGDGCNTTPIYIISIFANNTNITSNNIINITTGSGPNAVDNTNGGIGGSGGSVYAIYLAPVSNVIVYNNNISKIQSGNGGNGGNNSALATTGGNGGSSGNVSIIYITYGTNISIINNNITNAISGNGGNGGLDTGAAVSGGNGGSSGNVSIIYITYSTNISIINNNIASTFSGISGNGGTSTWYGDGGSSSNSGSNYGLWISNSSIIIILNNSIYNIHSGNGGNGAIDGAATHSGFGGSTGNTSAIYILTSQNANITSNSISGITSGNGGTTATTPDGGNWGGFSGIANGIYIYTVTNASILQNNLYNISSGIAGNGNNAGYAPGNGSNSGTGSAIISYYSNNSIIASNNISNIISGIGGTGGNVMSGGVYIAGLGGFSGNVYGIYVYKSYATRIYNNNMTIIQSQNGGNSGTTNGNGINVNSASGNISGISIDSSNNITINTNNILGLYSGNGGNAGKAAGPGTGMIGGIGGNSGDIHGITIYATNNSNISLNNIINLKAGTSGNGGNAPATGGNAGIAGIVYGIYNGYSYNNTYFNNTINTLTSGSGGNGGANTFSGSGGNGGNSGNTIGINIVNSNNNNFYLNNLYNYSLGTVGIGGIGLGRPNGLNGYNGTITGLIIDSISGYNTFFWNNFSIITGLYVNDSNGTNFYNTTISNHAEGNLWYNVVNGSVNIAGTNNSIGFPSLYYGIIGAGYPYNNSTSQGKVSSTVVDYAPITPTYVPFPTTQNARIAPSPAYVTSNLVGYCNATTSDGSNVSYNYTWYMNGVLNLSGITASNYSSGLEVNVANISSAALLRWQNWTLYCQGITSIFSGNIVDTNITILNSPPTQPLTPNITIPAIAYKNSILNSSVGTGSTDPNGDTITYYYVWYNGTNILQNSVNNTFDCSAYMGCYKGVSMYVATIAYDGYNYSTQSSYSTGLIIQDTPPTTPSSFTFNTGNYRADSFNASCNGSTDIDSDTITYYYQFETNTTGTILQAYSTNNSYTNCASNIACNKTSGIRVKCEAYDGQLYSIETSYLSRTILNTPPTTPSTPPTFLSGSHKGDTFTLNTCNGSTDIDPEDAVSYEYQFETNTTGIILQPWSSSNSYNGCAANSACNKTANIRATCRATDGTNTSNITAYSTQNILNTPPTTTSSRILPVTPNVTDTLSGYCNSTDIDDDNVQYNWTWYKNNIEYSNGATSSYPQGIETNVANISSTALYNGDLWTIECQASDTSLGNKVNGSVYVNNISCGTLLAANKTYNLNINLSSNTTCFTISAQNITINCSGNSITGNNTYYTFGIYSPTYPVNTTNCQNIFNFSAGIEQPSTTGNITTPDEHIYDKLNGVAYSFLYNVTINNTGNSSMNNISIIYQPTSNVQSVSNYSTNCQPTLFQNSTCIDIFNITTIVSLGVGQYPAGTFTFNYTNDNSLISSMQSSFDIFIEGNPKLSMSVTYINDSTNISQADVTNISLDNIGNVNLGQSGSVPNSIFVTSTGTIPNSWITYYSTYPYWNVTCGSNCFDTIYISDPTSLLVGILPLTSNYSAATYNSTISIASYSGGVLQLNNTINVTVQFSPNMSISPAVLNVTQSVTNLTSIYLNVSSSGNTPIDNVTISYTGISLPQSWISLSSTSAYWNNSTSSWSRIIEGTATALNISLNATSASPGTYTGYLTINTTEGFNSQVNISVLVSPQLSANNITDTIEHSTNHTDILTINSSGNYVVHNVNVSYTSGTLPSSWVTLSSGGVSGQNLSIGDIPDGMYKNINVTVSVPAFQDPGIYYGEVNITSSNAQPQIINITITVPTNSTWSIIPPLNISSSLILNQGGVIGNITLNNTGNIPENFTLNYNIQYNAGGDLCYTYYCLGTPQPAGSNPTSIYIGKNSTYTLGVTAISSSVTKTNVGVEINMTSNTGPSISTVIIVFNVTNQPPQLVQLGSSPNNYTQIGTPIGLFAQITDDEPDGNGTGLNLSSVYFNITSPNGTIYTIGSNSISYINMTLLGAANRKMFNATFANTSLGGIYNISVYIQDMSGNVIAPNNYSFTSIGYTNMTILAATNSSVYNVTMLHGDSANITINASVTGLTNAYNISITALQFSGINASSNNASVLIPGQNISGNITLNIPAATIPGIYALTPIIYYQNANGSQANSTGQAFTINVTDNPEVQLTQTYSIISNHNSNSTLNISINSTGITNYGSALSPAVITFQSQNIPTGWISFDPSLTILTKTLGILYKNTTTNITAYITIPKGAPPGNYTGTFNVTSALYNSTRYPYSNFTLTILLDSNSWNATIVYSNSSIGLNTPQTIGIVNITNNGNGNLSFAINYTNFGSANYSDYPGLFNLSQNVSGTTMNPISITITPASSSQLFIYQNGYPINLTSIGINATISTSSINKSASFLFDISDKPPQISEIDFTNNSNRIAANYTELNTTIKFKGVVSDDDGINISSLVYNISMPNGTILQVLGNPTSENSTLYGNYVLMNFSGMFNGTAIAGAYNITATVRDITGYYATSSAFGFEVIGKTSLNISANTTYLNASNITLYGAENLSIGINLSNTGYVNAYNINIGLIHTGNTSNWTYAGTSLQDYTSGNSAQLSVNLTVPANTPPGTYNISPVVNWTNPDGTSESYVAGQINVTVASNKIVHFTSYASSFNITHGTTNTSQIQVESVGNDIASNVIIYLLNVPQNFTVNASPPSISSISNGDNVTFNLSISPAQGMTNNTYSFDVKLRNDNKASYSDNYTTTVIVPASYTWNILGNNITLQDQSNYTVNGVSNQTLEDKGIVVTSTANVPITFNAILTGVIRDAGIMSVENPVVTLQPLESYTIILNHTAPVSNSNYTGLLTIDDGVSPLFDINIDYESHIANLTINSVMPNSSLIAGQAIIVNSTVIYQSSPVTNNITPYILIDNTSCPVIGIASDGTNILVNCTLPDVADGVYHDITSRADYLAPSGIVSIYKTQASAVYYRDVTSPTVIPISLGSVEIGDNATISVNASDNIGVDTVIASITSPTGIVVNYTLSNAGGSQIYNITLNTSNNMSSLGTYIVRFIVNDTTGNINSTESSSIVVYGYRSFSGRLVDLNNVPFQANFTLVSSNGNTSFGSNATGYYNFTVLTLNYNITMSVSPYNITIYNVSFSDLGSSFMMLDRIASSDISSQLAGAISGIVVDTNMPENASITIDFSNDTIISKDNLRIYQCGGWNYTARTCSSVWWQQLNNQIDKINNIISATVPVFTNDTSAFVLSEIPSNPTPVINLPVDIISMTINHSSNMSSNVELQSVGTAPLTNIYSTCTSGSLCTGGFIVTSSNISMLPVGTFSYMNFTVYVPAFEDPGIYTGTQTITAGTTSQPLTINVNVPAVSSYNYSISSNNSDVGSLGSGILSMLSINNTGNSALYINITSNDSNVFVINESIIINKNTIVNIPVYYTAPHNQGQYSYNISMTNSLIGNRSFALYLNVSHESDIVSIVPNSNISAGDNLTIDAYAKEGVVFIDSNVTWNATINGTACSNISYLYSALAGYYVISCIAPSVPDKTNHTITLSAYFDNFMARDMDNITYKDVFPPDIFNVTDSAQETGGNIEINATAIDDNGIGYVNATIIQPDGTLIVPTIRLAGSTIILDATLTQLGDYNITYTASDLYNNTGTTSALFELYQPVTFSGSILTGNGTGVPNVTFDLYRRPGDVTEQFTTASDGSYSDTIRNRTYAYMGVNAFNTNIMLANVTVYAYANKFYIQSVDVSKLSIADTSSVVMGFAVNTTINTTGTVTFNYAGNFSGNPSDLRVYRCHDWSYVNNSCNQLYWTYISSTLGINTVNFTVSGFSAYVLASAATPAYVVGDGICSSNAGESYLNSPDCPAPNSNSTTTISNSYTTSGGGGGGGGSSVVNNYNSVNNTELKNLISGILSQNNTLEVDTSQISRDMYPGEIASSKISIKNLKNTTMTIRSVVSGQVKDYVMLPNSTQDIAPQQSYSQQVNFVVPSNVTPGLYSGQIVVMDESGNTLIKVPLELRVIESNNKLLDLKITPLTDHASPGDTLRIETDVFNLGSAGRVDVQLKIELLDPDTLDIITETEDSMAVETSASVIKSIKIPQGTRLGRYVVQAEATYTNQQASMIARSIAMINIVKPWYEYMVAGIVPVWIIIAVVAFFLINIGLFEIYEKRRNSAKKYQIPVDIHSLPAPGPKTMFVGNIAETHMRTFFDIDRLQTHTIVAGSTGSGKSIAAQVIAEEALKNKVAVIVFDPTAQWTGFLRRSGEKRMLRNYKDFGMSPREARTFNGNIRTVRNPLEKINISGLSMPGEINIFDISKLDPKSIDLFVSSTVKQVFDAHLEESPELKLLIIYDEVHRLLPKFGGSGEGFLQIERAVREFRKWGVGILLISQVMSDFIGQIKSNINTEVQMKTKDEDDLNRARVKYGDEFLRSIVKANVGTGMVQNSEYNKGRPYFISFRPILHSVQRLSDEELGRYEKYNSRLDDLKFQTDKLKKYSVDVFDIELELKLALDKLREGAFNMVDIYLEELEPRVASAWQTSGKQEEHYVKELVSEQAVMQSVQRAAHEKDKIEKTRTIDEPYMNKPLAPKDLYIIKEKKNDTAISLYTKNIDFGSKGLCITRTNPEQMKQRYGFKTDKIIWLSTQEDAGILPNMIEQIYEAIVNFINEQQGKEAVILLDGLTTIISNTSYDRTYNLLIHLKDMITGKNAKIIIPFNTGTLKKEEREQAESEFKIIDGGSQDDAGDDAQEDSSQNNNSHEGNNSAAQPSYDNIEGQKAQYNRAIIEGMLASINDEKDNSRLTDTYKKILPIYKTLDNESKKKYYPIIMQIYSRINAKDGSEPRTQTGKNTSSDHAQNIRSSNTSRSARHNTAGNSDNKTKSKSRDKKR